MKCYCCKAPLEPGIAKWHLICPICKYELSTLEPQVNTAANELTINEESRRIGLDKLRKYNFSKILKQIEFLRPHSTSEIILDVGAAHGWFVELAQKFFLRTVGIEPDLKIGNETISRGIPLILGYFPQALRNEEQFDVITFNDVFEHIPNAILTLEAIRKHMRQGGLLVLNLPTTNGIFYRLSKALYKLGITSPFERMWQKDMPSPHLHYFSKGNLDRLLSENGFHKQLIFSIPSIQFKGLYARISLSKRQNKLMNIALWILLVIALPFLFLFPHDTTVFAYALTKNRNAC